MSREVSCSSVGPSSRLGRSCTGQAICPDPPALTYFRGGGTLNILRKSWNFALGKESLAFMKVLYEGKSRGLWMNTCDSRA